MKIMLSTIMCLMLSASAFAADATCDATSKDKKLHGAALKSFMTKCEKDATSKCASEAKDKKLHGAAETSFTKKCVKDASGV
jgi:hypothetical protein